MITLTIFGITIGAKALITILAAMAVSAVILSNPDVQRGLADMISFYGNGIKTICESIAKAVDDAYKKAKNKSKNNKHELHHMVAQSAKAAAPARGYLSHKNVNISVNSSANLVSIKYNLHKHLHTTSYYVSVNLIVAFTNSKKISSPNTMKALNYIRALLLAASKATP